MHCMQQNLSNTHNALNVTPFMPEGLAQTVLERSAEIDEKVRGAATQTVAIYITRDRRKQPDLYTVL
uniref:SFRICE_022020 n=1 Tax=Spodoptera frugiperda TaxID=7108 RepID=A0A2H1WZN1_SPOFR